MSKDTNYTLGDLITLQRGFDITKSEQTYGPYPVVSSSGITSYHLEYKAKGPGVVIGRKGTLGTAFYIDKDFWPHDTTLWVKDFKGNDPYYVYCLLSLLHLEQLDTGSANPTLNRNYAHQIPIREVSFDTQKDISKVICSIDGKISNNAAICSELEAMAKTLYDYWFVQFDFPDENGRPYRASGGEMVWNKQLKREIPKGWTVGKLCDIANITMGQSPAGESYNEMGEGTIFYQGRTDFGLRFPTPRMYTTAPTRFAKKGDILLSVRAPVGDLNIAMENCCIGRGLAALNSKIGSQMHLFYTLAGFKQLFDIMDGNGTTFGSITKDILFDMSVVIPTNPLLCEFEKHIKPIETKIQVCEQENRELIKLRDWLLPMLMNGQARVE